MTIDPSRIVDALPALIWTAGRDGRVDFVSRQWCDYTGLTNDDARGDGWQAALHPDDLVALRARWAAIVSAEEPAACEARLRRADGCYRWFLLRFSTIRDEGGEITGWCGVNTDIHDRWQAEDALRAQEGHFRSIVEGIPALVTLMTPDGQLCFVNQQVEKYFGATSDELRGLRQGETVHVDDRAHVLAVWNRSVASGEPFDVEARRPGADGVARWFHLRGLPMRDADGRILFWYLLHTDIDDRKRAERVLSGEKRLLEMIASGRPLLEVLDALCRLFEETVEGACCNVLTIDSLGTTFELGAAPVVASEHLACEAAQPVQCDTGPAGMAASLKRQIIVSDLSSDSRWGGHRWHESTRRAGWRSCWSTPILSRSQKALGTFSVYRRVPGVPTPFDSDLLEQLTHLASIAIERAQSDAELARNSAFLVRAQQLSSTGSYWWRVETDEIKWSEQLYRIYEFEQGAPITHPLIFTRFFPEEVHLLQSVIAQANGVGRDFEYEHRLLMPDGSTKHVQVVAHGAYVEGRLEFIGAVRDVTERRLTEEALGRVRSELAHVARVTSLGALAASIAHEVNQPLSGIVTNASTCLRMLGSEPPNVAGARETARRTIRDGNRAADVITRLRALFSKKEVASESVDLNEAASEVAALMRNEFQRAGVVAHQHFERRLPHVIGDRVQLQQVILNLLLNAMDSMVAVVGRSRTLTVRTALDAQASAVRLLVEDAGVGLDAQAADRIFEPFYTTKPTGMGIGLSVSRTIIEHHHGRLWAVDNDGPGATFAFTIPFATEAVEATRSATAAHDAEPTIKAQAR